MLQTTLSVPGLPRVVKTTIKTTTITILVIITKTAILNVCQAIMLGLSGKSISFPSQLLV